MKKYIVTLMPFFALADISAPANEVRVGVMQHDLNGKFKQRYEKGQNIIAEYIFTDNELLFKSVPHIGVSINNSGYTSNIYAGLTWKFYLKEKIFVEFSLGGSINNGNRKKKDNKKLAIGSNILFRESFSLGYDLNEKNSISIMVDHTSSADITKPNPGLTDLGLRYGFKF